MPDLGDSSTPLDPERMERGLRHIVNSVAQDRNAPEAAIYLADVAAVALGAANPTTSDREWLGPDA